MQRLSIEGRSGDTGRRRHSAAKRGSRHDAKSWDGYTPCPVDWQSQKPKSANLQGTLAGASSDRGTAAGEIPPRMRCQFVRRPPSRT